jgi:hypothetical protein
MSLNGQWIEIFRAGDYGDKGKFTAADLDQMVTSYDPAKHEAPVVVGHPEHDAPAFGWVDALRRDGDVVFGRLKQVPPEFDQWVRDGRYKKRSVAIYRTPDGLVLRHVGFLGALPPEVKGLADVKMATLAGQGFQTFEFAKENSSMETKEVKQTFMEALKEFFKDFKDFKIGGSETKSFSEEDVKRISTEAVKAAVTEATAPLKTEITTLTTKFAESQTSAAATAKSKSADEAIAELKSKGKWIPAFEKMGAPQLFVELAKSEVKITFGEGEKKIEKSPLQLFADFLGGLQQIVPAKEISGAANGARKGNLIKFTEPTRGAEIDQDSVAQAEAAQQLVDGGKCKTFGEALQKVRREGVTAGQAAAGAV